MRITWLGMGRQTASDRVPIELPAWRMHMPLVLAVVALPWQAVMNWVFLHLFPGNYHYSIYDDWATGIPWWACVVLPALISMGLCCVRLIRRSRMALTGLQMAILMVALLLSMWTAGGALFRIVIRPPNPHAPGYWQSVGRGH